jgi:HSP20 family protein
MRLVRYSYPAYRTPSPFFPSLPTSPWSGLDAEIERLFDSARAETGAAASGRFPLDLYEDKANSYVRAELPGVRREDIQVELNDGTLVINATRPGVTPENTGAEAASAVRAFRRAITLANDIQADKISAAYENGILTVTVPKAEEAKTKKVTVAVS